MSLFGLERTSSVLRVAISPPVFRMLSRKGSSAEIEDDVEGLLSTDRIFMLSSLMVNKSMKT